MDTATPVILRVETPSYGRVIVEGSDRVRYHADLSSLDRVYCYPRDDAAWRQVSPDSYGLGLIWASRFEVHIDQVIGLAERTEPIERSA